MDRESSYRSIHKSGSSPFSIEGFTFSSDAPLFAPVAALNGLRRTALEKMQSARLNAYVREPSKPRSFSRRQNNVRQPVETAVFVRSAGIDQLESFIRAGADHFLYAPQDYTSASLAEDCGRLRREDYFCLPPQASDSTLKALHTMVCQLGLQVVADNIGQLALPWPAAVISGPGIPVWNRFSAQLLADLGCHCLVCSRENSREEINDLDGAAIPFILPVYGRASVMLLNHCPERTLRGLGGDKRSCRLCDQGSGTLGGQLLDRLSAAYPLCPIRLPEGCLNVLMHHTPLHLSNMAAGKRWLLTFTTETREDALSITRNYAALLHGENPPRLPGIPPYSGRYEQGVQ